MAKKQNQTKKATPKLQPKVEAKKEIEAKETPKAKTFDKPKREGYSWIMTTHKNKHFKAGSIIERKDGVADILVKKGYAIYV